MSGAYSHVDTFDPKPRLIRDHDVSIGPELRAAVSGQAKTERFLKAPLWRFRPNKKCGTEVSDLFPHLREVMHEVALVRSMHSDHRDHGEATLQLHTGSTTIAMPSLGAWLSYGLGTFNDKLPAHVVISEHRPYSGPQIWDANFLPGVHCGVRIKPGDEPLPHLKPASPANLQELELGLLETLNRRHIRHRPGDSQLATRMESFRTAKGLQDLAPDVLDLSQESKQTLELYGSHPSDRTSYAAQCVMARRLIENGVRFVEIIDAVGACRDNWDAAHRDVGTHAKYAKRVDQPIAGLIEDLKQRGLFNDTLLVFCTEFGRTPWAQDGKGTKSRNHHPAAFSCWLAGGGVKPGIVYGRTDDIGNRVEENAVHMHDHGCVLLDGGKYRMWYGGIREPRGGEPRPPWYDWIRCGYAESDDGIHWKRIKTRQVEWQGSRDNNILPFFRHSPLIFRDDAEPDPQRRYKAFYFWNSGEHLDIARSGKYGKAWDPRDERFLMDLFSSADGIHFERQEGEVVFPSEQARPLSLIPQSIFRDEREPDPQKRFKAYGFSSLDLRRRGTSYIWSPDCLHWTAHPELPVIDPAIRGTPPAAGGPTGQVHDTVCFPYEGYYIALYQDQHDPLNMPVELAVSRDSESFRLVQPGQKVIPVGSELRVELIDASTGKSLPGFSSEDCHPVQGDQLDTMVMWRGKEMPNRRHLVPFTGPTPQNGIVWALCPRTGNFASGGQTNLFRMAVSTGIEKVIVPPTFDHADWQFRDDVIPRVIVPCCQDRIARQLLPGCAVIRNCDPNRLTSPAGDRFVLRFIETEELVAFRVYVRIVDGHVVPGPGFPSVDDGLRPRCFHPDASQIEWRRWSNTIGLAPGSTTFQRVIGEQTVDAGGRSPLPRVLIATPLTRTGKVEQDLFVEVM